jgi:hypothetical protein
MWQIITGTLALLAVIVLLTVLQNGQGNLDPRQQLSFERQRSDAAAALRNAKFSPLPALACAATRAQNATVETLYRVWINNHAELATDADRDAASQDLARQITACGASPDRVEDAAHAQGLDLENAAAKAMLLGGR